MKKNYIFICAIITLLSMTPVIGGSGISFCLTNCFGTEGGCCGSSLNDNPSCKEDHTNSSVFMATNNVRAFFQLATVSLSTGEHPILCILSNSLRLDSGRFLSRLPGDPSHQSTTVLLI